MQKVSSIRWNDAQLYEHVQAYAALKHQKINNLIMEAVSEYLKNHAKPVSKLTLQTQNMAVDDHFDLDEWANGQDTSGWE